MPTRPPALDQPPRFDPVYVTDEDLDDLATFTGLSRDECLQRLKTYSPAELAEAWTAANPSTPEEIVRFYEQTDLYVWELMQWHASQARAPYWAALSSAVERFPPSAWPRVYEFGCGIGTDSLFLAQHGYDVVLVDVESPTLAFARHRFARRNVRGRFEVSTGILPQPVGTFDVAVCMDVFEHLPQPVAAARRIVEALRPGGVLIQQGVFADEGTTPCHLHEHHDEFGGFRWYAHLSSLGMKGLGGFLFQKEAGTRAILQKARHRLWRATGFWLVRA